MTDLRTAAQQEPVAWLRVIDDAMVTHHLGVADLADDYETAKRKMNNLLCMAQDIGAYFARPQRTGVSDDEVCDGLRGGLCIHQDPNQCDRQRDCPASQQAEPVEPVAWVSQANLDSAHITRDRGGQGDTHTWSETRSSYHGVPLYIAPPQRLPLTEEEIESCRQKGYAHAGLGAPFDFDKAARAVEKAVWEKNHG